MKKKEIMEDVNVAVEVEETNLMNYDQREISKNSSFQFEKLWYFEIKSKCFKSWAGQKYFFEQKE